MHDDPTRHGVAQAKIVGSRHAIDEHPGLIAPRHGLDHTAIIRNGHLAGQLVASGSVIETAIKAPDMGRKCEPLQRLVHDLTRAEIEEIDRRPDSVRRCLDTTGNLRLEIRGAVAHGDSCPMNVCKLRTDRKIDIMVRKMYTNFGHQAVPPAGARACGPGSTRPEPPSPSPKAGLGPSPPTPRLRWAGK